MAHSATPAELPRFWTHKAAVVAVGTLAWEFNITINTTRPMEPRIAYNDADECALGYQSMTISAKMDRLEFSEVYWRFPKE